MQDWRTYSASVCWFLFCRTPMNGVIGELFSPSPQIENQIIECASFVGFKLGILSMGEVKC